MNPDYVASTITNTIYNIASLGEGQVLVTANTNDGSNIQTHTHSQWANNTAIRFFAQYRTT